MNSHKNSTTEPSYRIGCTSYCLPDDILPNIKTVATLVDDIEILLFESDHSLNFKNLEIIDDLKQLATIHNLTYTVHFPLDMPVHYGRGDDNTLYLNQITKIVEITHTLSPFAYILHLDGIDRYASLREKNGWKESCVELCSNIAKIPNIEKEKICLENLDYPLAWTAENREMCGFSLCMDIGHLWKHEHKWEELVIKYLPLTRVVHLHGVNGGKDHLSLKKNNIEHLLRFVSLLEMKFRGVVTLEVFSLKDVIESYDILKRIRNYNGSLFSNGM